MYAVGLRTIARSTQLYDEASAEAGVCHRFGISAVYPMTSGKQNSSLKSKHRIFDLKKQ